jgi:hypothetical protein
MVLLPKGEYTSRRIDLIIAGSIGKTEKGMVLAAKGVIP